MNSPYPLLLAIILGSFVVYKLPVLPAGAHIVLQSLWLLGVWLVLSWQLMRLIGNQAHLVFARLGWRTAKAPARYVRALFDDYAERFDRHLLIELEYAVPNLLRRIVNPHLDSAPRMVDLGCGTGLCGPLFRPLAGQLTGVDLSPAMLRIARRRNVYDDLIQDDIVRYLSQYTRAFDLCIAADVLVYLGDLRPFFAAAGAALYPGGGLAFSVESTTQRDWILQRTGRYAHSQAYIESLAQQFGFDVEAKEQVTLRTQDAKPVVGSVWLLRRISD